jgi:hypothetical protein
MRTLSQSPGEQLQTAERRYVLSRYLALRDRMCRFWHNWGYIIKVELRLRLHKGGNERC